jgi:hypothetical protein
MSEGPAEPHTPQNTVAFPSDGATPGKSAGGGGREGGKRTLSDLLKVYAEEGTDVNFSTEEAGRLAEVLGQWVRRPHLGECITSSKLTVVAPCAGQL